MAIKVGDVLVKIGVDTTGLDRGLKSAGDKMTHAGKQLSMKVTAPLTVFGALSIRTAADFSKSMAKVNAVTGATSTEFTKLTQQAKDLGATTQFTATQAAEAMTFMGMAGMDSAQIMKALPDTLNLAAAGTLDMGTAANIVTNILAGFGMETEELGGAVDILSKAFTSSNVDLVQLGDSMRYAGPVAKGFGLSLAETTAIMGSFGNAGIQGSLAGTSLRGAIIQLDKKAAKFGITMRDATGKMLPMADILEQLEERGITTSEAMELFGLRAGPAMVALLETGSDALRDFTKELEDSGGTAEQIAKTQMEGLHGSLITLKSAFESLQIAIAEQLVPIFTPLIEKLTAAFRRFGDLSSGTKKTIVVLGLLLASLGPVLLSMGLFIKSLLMAKTAVLAIRTAMIALRAAFVAVNPVIGIATLAIGALAIGVSRFIKSGKTARTRSREMGQELAKMTKEARTAAAGIASLESQLSALAREGTEEAMEQIVEIQEQLRLLIRQEKEAEEASAEYRDELQERLKMLKELDLKEMTHVQRLQEGIHSEKDLADAIAETTAELQKETNIKHEIALGVTQTMTDAIHEEVLAREAEAEAIGMTTDELEDLDAEILKANSNLNVHTESLRIAEEELDKARERFRAAEETVRDYERAISEANSEIDKLSRPRLEGMQEFEDQLFDIEMEIKKVQLAASKGTIDEEVAQDQIELLRKQRTELELTRDIEFDPVVRALTEAAEEAKGLNKEIGPEQVKKDIAEIERLGLTVVDLTAKLEEAERQLDIEAAAVKLHEDIVDHFSEAVRVADERLSWLEAQSKGHARGIRAEANKAAWAWQQVLNNMRRAAREAERTPEVALPRTTVPTAAGESSPAGAVGSGVADIQVNLDSETIMEAMAVPLVEKIRLSQALKE